MTVSLRPGMMKDRDEVIKKLVEIQYARNDMDFKRGTFRVRGDVLEIFPVSESEHAIRVEFFGDEVDRITEIDVLTGEIKAELEHMVVFPASHYVVDRDNMNRAIIGIENELEYRVKEFQSQDKLLEAQRISERTNFDIEMLRETGFCSGIENYSRHLSGLKPGQTTHIIHRPQRHQIRCDRLRNQSIIGTHDDCQTVWLGSRINSEGRDCDI